MTSKNGPEEKRTRILQALDQCLQEKPFNQTSIKDIARAAGVNHGLLHYYFKSKEDILLNYIDYVIHHFRTAFEEWLLERNPDTSDQKAFLEEFFTGMNERITSNRTLSKTFIEIWEIAAYNPAVKERLQKAYGEWIQVLADLFNRTVTDPAAARRMSMAVVAFLEGMALFSILLEPEPFEFNKVLVGFQRRIIAML